MNFSDVQDLIGLPYAHGARGPNAYDCWGLCVKIYARMNRDLPDYPVAHLTHEETKQLIMGNARDRAAWINVPEDWCFVMDMRSFHIGLYHSGRVIHSARRLGCVVQRLEHFRLSHPSVRFARWMP